MQGNNPPPPIHPGNRTSACAAKHASVYLYSSLKVYELLRVFFFRGGGRKWKTVPLPPESPSFIAAFLSPCNPPPCCWTGRKHKLHQTNPTPPRQKKKCEFPSSARRVNLGDKATIKHTSVGLKCAQKCARQSVREAGRKSKVGALSHCREREERGHHALQITVRWNREESSSAPGLCGARRKRKGEREGEIMWEKKT